jgi:hypothetical protein
VPSSHVPVNGMFEKLIVAAFAVVALQLVH